VPLRCVVARDSAPMGSNTRAWDFGGGAAGGMNGGAPGDADGCLAPVSSLVPSFGQNRASSS
jgi:hypothetical protein